LAARMFTKWSNFAKPKQTRAKARDYELGKTFRHTRSRGLKPAPRSWYEARSLLASFCPETAKNRMNTGFRAGKPRGLYAGRGPGRAKNRTRQAMKAVTGRVGASVADEIGVSVTREKLSGASAWFALFDEHLGDFQKVVGQNGDADE